MKPDKCTVLVVGGGNSAHTLIPLLSHAGHRVNLLTRQPHRWAKEVTVLHVLPSGSVQTSLTGRLDRVSDKPEDVVPFSDVIMVCAPVSKYRQILHHLAPFIDPARKLYLGTVYGQGGFNWMVDEIKLKHGLGKVVPFACGLTPWITRTKTYGSVGMTYGAKAVNVAAVSPSGEFKALNELLLEDLCHAWFRKGGFLQAANFLSLTLSVDNQVIHLSRLYGLHLRHGGSWRDRADVPMFYRDFDDISADLLRDVDADYTRIRNGITVMFPDRDFRYMLDYLALERLSYHSCNTHIKESFTTSSTLGQIPTPVVQNGAGEWVFDKTHRFFTDDAYYGLCIAKWIAEKLGVETPTIDRILDWAQGVLGDRIVVGGRLVIDPAASGDPFRTGIPSVYGYDSVEEIAD